MQYLYHPDASMPLVHLSGDAYRYISKVRRHRVDEVIFLRNLTDDMLYSYRIKSISRKEAVLELESSRKLVVTPRKKLHIGWCIVDPKSIEKALPVLNEIGVFKITFIYCSRSQKNFKLDLDRLHKILINSSQQCGRSEMMQLDICESLEQFKSLYPDSRIVHFSESRFLDGSIETPIIIGCEGGFTSDELDIFGKDCIVGLDTPLVLRSESAAVVAASTILL